MKTVKIVKIIIAAVAIIAVVVGLFCCFNGGIGPGIKLGGPDIKPKDVEKSIKERIVDAPDSKFCVKAYDDIKSKIDLYFKDAPTSKSTWTNNLNLEYTNKFVKQAMYVFDHNAWKNNDIATIRKEYKRCIRFSPDNNSLAAIKSILSDYDKLLKYDNEVSKACNQHPKCLNDPLYIYKEDSWDIAKTNSLINSTPMVYSKAKNAPLYQKTRSDQVRTRLKNAHRKFINDKMNRCEQEVKTYNYNPSRNSDYGKMSGFLYKDFETFYNKWYESVIAWQTRLKDWEQYAPDPTTVNEYDL